MISTNKIKEIIENEEEGPTLDYKQDLALETDGDKAEFVKDVIALANSGKTAHIIVGVEDSTGKPVGFKTPHAAEQINQILKDKCDPPINVEYIEKDILKYNVSVIEIIGENPPYVVSVPDTYGGTLSTNPKKSSFIQRGRVYVRNHNMNDGASRADFDRMYKKKFTTLEADLQLTPEVSVKPEGNFKEVTITFWLKNTGEVMATDVYIWMQFKNIEEIVRCGSRWHDCSEINENIPTVERRCVTPVVRPVRIHCEEVIVKVAKEVEQIEAKLIMGAINMRTIDGPYVILLEE